MTVLQLQCHVEETVDLLQDMGFDGHFIVVFLDQIHAELQRFLQMCNRAICGLEHRLYDIFLRRLHIWLKLFSETRRLSVCCCLTLSLWWRVLDVASHHSGWSLNRPPCRKRKSGHHSLSCSWFRISHVSFALGFLETSHVGFFARWFSLARFPKLRMMYYIYVYIYICRYEGLV